MSSRSHDVRHHGVVRRLVDRSLKACLSGAQAVGSARTCKTVEMAC